jgi:hypothetical protein
MYLNFQFSNEESVKGWSAPSTRVLSQIGVTHEYDGFFIET